MRLKITLAALAATVAFAAPAAAQVSASDNAEARGLVLLPLTLTRSADLDFGTVIASGVAGDVTIDEDSGARSTSGGVTPVPTAPGGRAVFDGAGTAGQQVDLTLAPPAGNVLVSGANTINISNFTLDGGVGLSDSRIIGVTGAFTVGVGGTFDIAANQPNGLYTASFSLTAQYQ